jgi:hypothetical protein
MWNLSQASEYRQGQVLEMPFPNDDQRNTWKSLSKVKRKVLLLQKGAATDCVW